VKAEVKVKVKAEAKVKIEVGIYNLLFDNKILIILK
jgi:hypothetical protein